MLVARAAEAKYHSKEEKKEKENKEGGSEQSR